MISLLQVGVIAVPLATGALVLGAVNLWFRREQLRRSRSPFTKDLLRAPGESLREKLDEIYRDMLAWSMLATVWPPIIASIYLAQHFESGHDFTSLALYGSSLFIGMSIILWRVLKLLRKIRDYRLGLDGEVATGQLLNELVASGCQVYHDIPAKYGNIDHLVVGPGGVFAIETKAKSKPTTRGSAKENARAIYDGATIQFPQSAETKALDQARIHAKWARQWLSESTGSAVKVTAVVALPGWFVDRKGRSEVLVINPEHSQSRFMAKPGQNGALTPEQIRRIKYQIDQKNRDVSPYSKRFD